MVFSVIGSLAIVLLVGFVFPVEGAVEPLSLARHSLCATSVSNLTLFAGGFTSNLTNSSTNRVDIRDSRGIWTTATLSLARSFVAATSGQGMALFAGGFTGQSFSVLFSFFSLSC